MSSKLINCSAKKCSKEESVFKSEKQKLVHKNEQLAKKPKAVNQIKNNNNKFINSKANKSLNNCHSQKCPDETKELIKEYLIYAKQGCDAKSKAMCDLLKTYGKLLNKDKISGDDKRILEQKYLQALFS